MPHLLFIVSKYYVGHFHYVPQQALKSWKEPVHLEKIWKICCNILCTVAAYQNTGRKTQGLQAAVKQMCKCAMTVHTFVNQWLTTTSPMLVYGASRIKASTADSD